MLDPPLQLVAFRTERGRPGVEITVAAVRRHVAFYVPEYNATIPHAAFSGQTPDEIYFDRGGGIPAKLEAGKRAARERRMAVNRAVWCERCRDIPGIVSQGAAA